MKIQSEIVGLGAFFLIFRFGAEFVGWQLYMDSRDTATLFIILCLLILAKGLDEVIFLMRQIKDKTNNS